MQRQRTKLQEVLKAVIGDAQASGAQCDGVAGGRGLLLSARRQRRRRNCKLQLGAPVPSAPGYESKAPVLQQKCTQLNPVVFVASSGPLCLPAGELWTRDWDAMPLPDLSLSAADATAVLTEVAAVSGPVAAAAAAAGHAAAGFQASAARPSRWQAHQAYARQQQETQQVQRQQQQHLNKQQQKQAGKWAQRQRQDDEDLEPR